MTHHNANDDQEVERPTHFKDVFGTTKDSCPAGSMSAADNGLNTANVDVSESRRPSVVMPPIDAGVVRRTRKTPGAGAQVSARAGSPVDAASAASTLTPIRSKISKISSSKIAAGKIPSAVSGAIQFASPFGAYPAGRVCKIRGASLMSRRRHYRSRSLPNIWLSLSEFSAASATAPAGAPSAVATDTGASLTHHHHHRHHRANSRRSRRWLAHPLRLPHPQLQPQPARVQPHPLVLRRYRQRRCNRRSASS